MGVNIKSFDATNHRNGVKNYNYNNHNIGPLRVKYREIVKGLHTVWEGNKSKKKNQIRKF